jgi:hypothetical protein
MAFMPENHTRLPSWLFSQKRFGYDATWDGLKTAHPEILQLTNRVEVLQKGQTYVVTASFTARQPQTLKQSITAAYQAIISTFMSDFPQETI